MQKLKVNEEFKDLISPLTPEEREGLKKSLLMFGCRDKIITWNGFIIDGHNRYELCTENGIEYETFSMDYEFEDKEEVKQWIIKNQFARRNISVYQRSALALKLKESIAEKAKENQGIRSDLTSVRNMTNVKSNEESTFKEIVSEENSPNSKPVITSIDTKKELAKIAGVSHDTIHKVEIIEHEAPSVIKDAAKENHISVNKAYNITKEVKDLQEDKKQDKATELLNQQYDTKAKEIDRQKKIADKIADAIFGILTVDIDEEKIGYYLEYSPKENMDKHIARCNEAIEKLQEVKSIFQNMKKIKVVK
ncbi:hypothetical protein [Clostridium coskatii]|uniref:ParB/Sulfiredoxin domain-containing protein n=1 Tax=Clostridium coskatii TaxID=1705578 RepID=A0A166T143_9CLOT|nr:hypothetical protein [Clostridium coskatii]OAA93043.1 hypothetical protein WX73_00361 [Clostridium coskatii]OBR90786.1 hypothetical protein CLCOS_37610 [Clostridium coskatii]